MIISKARLLWTALNVGHWLNMCHRLFELGQSEINGDISWCAWVKKNSGLSYTYAVKYMKVVEMLDPFKKFAQVAVSFDFIYRNRNNIKEMLKNPEVAEEWMADIPLLLPMSNST